jgi:hypothetical protein
MAMYRIDRERHTMNFTSGALPNVMFIVGMIAIGIGLGLEFKIVEIQGSLSRTGRLGAFGVGAVLIATSIYLYTRPPQTATTPAAAAIEPTAQASSSQPSAQPSVVQSTNVAPTPASPTATPPPTAAPAATATPKVKVPDIRGKSPKDAQHDLATLGLALGKSHEDCAEIADQNGVKKVKKGAIMCQSAAPQSLVGLGSSIDYVISNTK